MTFKDKVIKYLEDFIDDKFCDYATGRDLRVFILPHIKSMQEDPAPTACHWKPTEEQLASLENLIMSCEDEWGGTEYKCRCLLEQLKEL